MIELTTSNNKCVSESTIELISLDLGLKQDVSR